MVDVLVKKGSEIRIDDGADHTGERQGLDGERVPSPVSGVVESIELKKGDEWWLPVR